MRSGPLLLMFVVGAALPCSVHSSGESGLATLRGVVVDERRHPVGGAIVGLRGGPPPAVVTAVTDAKGSFSFTDLPAASFLLTASRSGYPTVQYGQPRPLEPGTPIILRDDEASTITVRMPRGAVIAGIVTDTAGQSVVGQIVTAKRENASIGSVENTSMSAVTDGAGRFRMVALPAGVYFLNARQSTTEWLSGNEPSPADVRVTVSAGEIRDGVALHAPPLAGAAPVRIVPASHVPFDHRSLQVKIVTDSRRQPVGQSATIDADGSQTFTDVPKGRYIAVARTTGRGLTLWGSTDFATNGERPATVPVALNSGVRVSGSITFDGASKQPAPQRASITLVPEPDNPFYKLFNMGGVETRIDWTYSFEIASVPPGRYSVSVNGEIAPWTIESAMLAGTDALDVPVELVPSGEYLIGLTFTDVQTELSGVVSAGGAAASDLDLIAFPADKGYWRSSRRVLVTRSDSNGRYVFKGLPPGEYQVARLPKTLPDQSRPQESLSTLKAIATVTLDRGGRQVRDLAVR